MSYATTSKVPGYRASVDILPRLISCRKCGEVSGSRGDSHLHGPMRHKFAPKVQAMTDKQLRRDHCAAMLIQGYRHSRMHSRIAQRACERYGDHGPDISAVVRDHFPEGVKTLLRDHALATSNWINASFLVWTLSGFRRETWLRLKESIIAEHGRGFYG